jgi:hypothetical protein
VQAKQNHRINIYIGLTVLLPTVISFWLAAKLREIKYAPGGMVAPANDTPFPVHRILHKINIINGNPCSVSSASSKPRSTFAGQSLFLSIRSINLTQEASAIPRRRLWFVWWWRSTARLGKYHLLLNLHAAVPTAPQPFRRPAHSVPLHSQCNGRPNAAVSVPVCQSGWNCSARK